MAFVFGNWWALLPAPWSPIALTIAAVVAGAIIGVERERREKPAGLRTLVLVCLGSAVFTMTGFAFTTTTGDSGRVAAQIVTGVGFLGGGVILRESIGVTGATTAASIWITAAMGMLVGSGRGGAGVALALAVRLVLVALYMLEEHWVSALADANVTLVVDPDHGKTRILIERILVEYDLHYAIREMRTRPDGLVHMVVRFRLALRHWRQLLADLAALPAVREIEEGGGEARG